MNLIIYGGLIFCSNKGILAMTICGTQTCSFGNSLGGFATMLVIIDTMNQNFLDQMLIYKQTGYINNLDKLYTLG